MSRGEGIRLLTDAERFNRTRIFTAKLTKEYGKVVLLSHQNLQLGGGHILDLEVNEYQD